MNSRAVIFSTFGLVLSLLTADVLAADLVDPSTLSCGTITYGPQEKEIDICCDESARPSLSKQRGDLVKLTKVSKKRRKAKQRGKTSAAKKWGQVNKAGKTFCTEQSAGGSEQSPYKHWSLNGEVNAVGKECFGIPAELSANVLDGENDWNEHCEGCHAVQVAQASRKFTYLRERIQLDPMYLFESDVNDAALAAITAYLNRFNPNDCPE